MNEKYSLTFDDVLKKTLVERNKGMFQGENFKRGCYLKAEDDVLSLYEYRNKDSFIATNQGSPVISLGLLTQKYREIFTRQESFN